MKYLPLIFSLCLLACAPPMPSDSPFGKAEENTRHAVLLRGLVNEKGQNIKTRFRPPQGYERAKLDEATYAQYLRNLPLKPHGSEVLLHDGSVKRNGSAHAAVVDLEIGKRNLHQCADAIIRLRAEYLWENNRFGEIHFNFTNGFRVDYSQWMAGKRVKVEGNTTYWVEAVAPSNTYRDFWKYMETIFAYAGTLSLSQELTEVDVSNMRIGDIFIQGGSPGHAVVVVDMAVNSETNEKVFMLAQSYMPAQELHVLVNPENSEISPWYRANLDRDLITPEWGFSTTDLKRFDYYKTIEK